MCLTTKLVHYYMKGAQRTHKLQTHTKRMGCYHCDHQYYHHHQCFYSCSHCFTSSLLRWFCCLQLHFNNIYSEINVCLDCVAEQGSTHMQSNKHTHFICIFVDSSEYHTHTHTQVVFSFSQLMLYLRYSVE